jgi:hypothetical protein
MEQGRRGGDMGEPPTTLRLKELSDWQLGRVRKALRAYRLYDPGADSKHTWRDVREAIAEYTGVEIGGNLKIGGERLRQFVEGVNNKSKGIHFPVPQPESLAAIVEFLSHEDINLLRPDELEEYRPGYQAALRYAEYLRESCEDSASVSASELCGTMKVAYKERDSVTVVGMTVQRVDGGDDLGIVQVIEECLRFEGENIPVALSTYNLGRKDKLISESMSGGWGVVTPEDTLVIFLKEDGSGQNHCYYAVNDLGVWVKKGKRSLYFMSHEFGIEVLDPLKADHKSIQNQAAQQVLEFRFSSR